MPAVKKPIVKKSKTSDAPATPKSSSKEIQGLVDSLNKKFGDNAIRIGFKNEDGEIRTLKRIPTGSLTLDIALGGGIPVGRFTQFSGALSSTKTTQAAHIVANAQKMGYVCAYADVENTCTDDYFESIGIDRNSLLYSNPDSLEEAAESILIMQKSGLVQLAVLDSIAALSANKEQEASMDENSQVAITPRLLGRFFRRFQMNNNRLVREGKEPMTLIGINQLREKIGSYGDPTYAPGGRSLGFTASVDLQFRRGDWITEGSGDNKKFVGQVVKFKIEKNKTYKRMQTGEFDFYFDVNNAGVRMYHNDTIKEIISNGVIWGVIQRSGAWYVYKDLRVQGLNGLISALRNDSSLIDEIKSTIFELMGKDR